jgi:hypothetical protein
MSSPYIVLGVVAAAVCGILVLLMFSAAVLTNLYPEDLNDHKDN